MKRQRVRFSFSGGSIPSVEKTQRGDRLECGHDWRMCGTDHLYNAAMQYRNNPEQAISCAGREVNGKCAALYAASGQIAECDKTLLAGK